MCYCKTNIAIKEDFDGKTKNKVRNITELIPQKNLDADMLKILNEIDIKLGSKTLKMEEKYGKTL